MVKPSLLPSLAVVVGLSIGLTGCGDDSSSKSETTTTVKALSSSALRTAADKICGEVKDKDAAVGQPESAADLEKMVPKILANSEQGIADLEDLKASKDDAAVMTELIGLLKDSNESLTALGKAAKANDEEAGQTASDAYEAKLKEFAEKAKAEGFTTCAEAGTAEEADTTDTTETTDTTDTTAATDAGFADIDLGEKLKPIDGFTYETLPDSARSALVQALGSSSEVKQLVSAIGTTSVTSADGQSLLIFLGLNRELNDDEKTQLVDGITSGGTDLEQGTVAGQTGYGYKSSDGQQGFVTVRSDTVIIGLSDSTDHLAAVIQGLFTANPEL